MPVRRGSRKYDRGKIPLLQPYPNPDKPEKIATMAPRHEAKPFVYFHLCVFAPWWRNFFS
jgi:hypothetical protein